MPEQEVKKLAAVIREMICPLKIYIFGPCAEGNSAKDSDLDFFIVVPDSVTDLAAETTKAYKAVRNIKTRPVDIVISTESRFAGRKNLPSFEREIYRHGTLLFEAEKQKFSVLCRLAKICQSDIMGGNRVPPPDGGTAGKKVRPDPHGCAVQA